MVSVLVMLVLALEEIISNDSPSTDMYPGGIEGPSQICDVVQHRLLPFFDVNLQMTSEMRERRCGESRIAWQIPKN